MDDYQAQRAMPREEQQHLPPAESQPSAKPKQAPVTERFGARPKR
jgi:hypothetical protein